MPNTKNNKNDGPFFHEMRESDPPAQERPSVANVRLASLTGILNSPFRTPYPTQESGAVPASGLAGELRGYYRRLDNSDRWKPSWSNFDHPRSGKTHKGVDIYAPVGTEVVAISDGYAMLYPNPSPGDELGIKLGITFTGSDGTKYDVLYGHLSELSGLSRTVKKGDVLGKTGCSGNAEDGICETAVNTCGGHSSHLHVAVRKSVSGAQYIDPLSLFDWKVGHAQDARDVLCSEAFPTMMLEHFEVRGTGEALSPEHLTAADYEGSSKSFRIPFFAEKTSFGDTGLVIFENLLITLKVINAGPFPGVSVSIKGRQRLVFHPSLSPRMSCSITGFFQNLDSAGKPIGNTVHVPLVSIKGEATSDTGLRSLWVDTLVQGVTLNLDQPVRFLGTVLQEV